MMLVQGEIVEGKPPKIVSVLREPEAYPSKLIVLKPVEQDRFMEGVEEMIIKHLSKEVLEAFRRHRQKIDFGERPAYPQDPHTIFKTWTQRRYGFY